MLEAQLILPVQLPQTATFANFNVEHNEVLLAQLRTALQDPQQPILLWGEAGVGLTHLCQACCHAASEYDLPSSYIPLTEAPKFDPSLLEDLASLRVICIDDVDCIAGHHDWERALFNLYNEVKQTETCLIMTSHTPIAELPIKLADLKSRIAGSLVYRVQALSDQAKRQVLQQNALQRGMNISAEVVEYLLNHYSRDMNSLMATLDILDQASLSTHRRLTIPFIKKILA